MIILLALSLVISVVLTALVVLANGMSDAVSQPFEGGSVIAVAWGVSIVLFLAWMVS